MAAAVAQTARLPRVTGIQIDFDAAATERGFYRRCSTASGASWGRRARVDDRAGVVVRRRPLARCAAGGRNGPDAVPVGAGQRTVCWARAVERGRRTAPAAPRLAPRSTSRCASDPPAGASRLQPRAMDGRVGGAGQRGARVTPAWIARAAATSDAGRGRHRRRARVWPLPHRVPHREPRQAADGVRYARGELGVVKPTFARRYLVQAYRTFGGVPPIALDARPADGGSARVARPSAGGSPVARAAGRRARTLRPITTYRIASDFSSFDNCLDPAFDPRSQRFAERATRYGARSPEAADWMAAQAAVFQNCGGGPLVLPAPAAPDADARLKADRDYQIAAAYSTPPSTTRPLGASARSPPMRPHRGEPADGTWPRARSSDRSRCRRKSRTRLNGSPPQGASCRRCWPTAMRRRCTRRPAGCSISSRQPRTRSSGSTSSRGGSRRRRRSPRRISSITPG